MNRPLMFAIAAFLLLIGISLAGKPEPVLAGFGHHGCHGCFRVAWCGGSCWNCGGCSGWHGCSGCYGYPARCHASYYSRYARCWTCSGCQGSTVVYRYSGCDCGGWSDCGGCHTVRPEEPREATPPPKPQQPEASRPTADTNPTDGQIVISLQCPADARVFINGYLTKSTGAERLFVSRVPETEQTYGYEIKTEVVRDGATLARTETARLRAGERMERRFEFAESAPVQRPVANTVSAGSK